jgi:hypothetical protein
LSRWAVVGAHSGGFVDLFGGEQNSDFAFGCSTSVTNQASSKGSHIIWPICNDKKVVVTKGKWE